MSEEIKIDFSRFTDESLFGKEEAEKMRQRRLAIQRLWKFQKKVKKAKRMKSKKKRKQYKEILNGLRRV